MDTEGRAASRGYRKLGPPLHPTLSRCIAFVRSARRSPCRAVECFKLSRALKVPLLLTVDDRDGLPGASGY
jgi:hypothetical protein